MPRALLVGCALVAACGSKPDRAARIDGALRTLCGERYRASIAPDPGSDARISGCRPESDEAVGIFAWFEGSSSAKQLTISVRGDEASLPGQVGTVTSTLAPLLDAEQRAVVAEELPMLVPDRFRPPERVVNGVAIGAATWIRDVPWDRLARMTVSFDVPDDGEARAPMAALLDTMGERFGWSEELGVLDATTVASWKAACAGGDWSAGDVWVRCRSADLTYWAEWAPRSRRLLRARVESRGDLAGAVEPLLFPLLGDEQRAAVRAGLAADVDGPAEPGQLHVRSEHGPDRHTISIAAEHRP